jgi:hypothetical protein
VPVQVRIYVPVQQEKDWACKYEIDWPERMRSMAAYGIDSAQALVLATYMVGTDLYCSDYHKNGQLMREGKSGDFGFPVPSIIRNGLPGYVDL